MSSRLFSASWALLVFGAALLAGCAGVRTHDNLRQAVASAYGAESFDRVEMIRYTFNARSGGEDVRRSWVWEPAEDRVTFVPGNGDPARTYRRAEVEDSPDPELQDIDARFVDDRYWLLFPFHLAWDRQAAVEDRGTAALPIGEGTARHLVVRYPAEEGSTPGEVYELFVGPDLLLRQWIHRRGGAGESARMSTWEDHRRVGPLVLSLDRRGPDEDFRVWFSDVSLRLTGSDEWIGRSGPGKASAAFPPLAVALEPRM